MTARAKKPRNKPYHPKGAASNVLAIFGGMGATHRDRLIQEQIKSHSALANMAKGTGAREDWNRIVGAINIANIMCEQGVGDEYRQITIAARDAMLAVGKRAVRNNDRFVFTGPELRAVSDALEVHDTQLENCRAIDVDRASDEVIRRERHRINSTSVMREIRKESA